MLEFVIAVVLAIAVAVLALWWGRTLFFILPMFHGPVFVPSADDKLEVMLEFANIKPGLKVADIGSGDGKVVIEAAKLGADVDGYEINTLLVRRSRKRIKQVGLSDKAKIYTKSFWKLDFSQYDVIFFYGTTYVMKRLQEKLKTELKPGAKFISNYFRFPDLKPVKEKNEVMVYQVSK